MPSGGREDAGLVSEAPPGSPHEPPALGSGDDPQLLHKHQPLLSVSVAITRHTGFNWLL